MWVFTTSGFLSAVYKDGALQVRARDRKSLDALAADICQAATCLNRNAPSRVQLHLSVY
jgi:hypothetical protein